MPWSYLAMTGSSPRMRGAPAWACYSHASYRIIPAYAGSTARGTRIRTGAQDHPRVCGEHADNGGVTAARQGSSPRMRGAR